MDEYLDSIDQIASERTLQMLKSQKKPKFKINRVPEELRSVPVYLDFEHEEYIFRDNFIWNLNDQHVSPKEFVESLVQKLGFGNVKQMHQQLLFQIMEYIEKHSVHIPDTLMQTSKKMQSEKKRFNQPAQRVSRTQVTRLSYVKQKCTHCQFLNISSGLYCKKCRIPFVILDNVNPSEPITRACFLFYEVVQNRAQSSIEPRRLGKEDFTSLYTLREKLVELTGENEEIEEVFQEFMKNWGKLDSAEFIASLKKPKTKLKRKNEKKVESGEEEESEQEEIQEEEQEEEEVKNESSSSMEEEQQQQEESQSESQRITTRRRAKEEILRRSVRKRR